MPCRHIIAVLQETDERMFSIRWHQMYQHCYLRKGKEDITRLYMDLETKERKMNLINYEHCYIGNRANILNSFGNNYPVLLHGAEESHYVEMKQIMDLKEKGVRPVRGDNLQELLEENKNDISANNEFNICLSQETKRMRHFDEEYKKQMVHNDLQELQSTVLPKIENSAGSKYHELVDIAKKILNAIGEDHKLYEKYYMQFKELESKCIQECVERDKKINFKTKTTTIEFPYTGKSRKKIEKRKRSFYEGKRRNKSKKIKK